MLFISMLIPTIGALLLFACRSLKPSMRNTIFLGSSVLASLCVLVCLLNPEPQTMVLFQIGTITDCVLSLDGLGRVFAGIIALLWPLASYYSIGYMAHEGKESSFFGFYLLSYAVTLGIAFSADIMTLFIFYEMLALSTLFLVMHKMKAKRVHAGRTYMYYSLGGAGLALIAVQFVMHYTGGKSTFCYGGIAALANAPFDMMLIIFLFGFFGFGVKAAIFPLHSWLPAAGVAPTPVTALLHAVAVVKAGVFAVIRLSHYTFSPASLTGTWVQTFCLIIIMISIVYGSGMAVKEQHLKRRLAYSTMSNLSYVLFGVMLLTPQGLSAGLAHMVFHAIMKITLFASVGAIMVQANRNYVEDIRGMSKVMPITIAVFTFCAIALVGIPPFIGFQSKWMLASAAIGTPLGIAGIVTLIISAILTAIYMLIPAVSAYTLPLSETSALTEEAHDPNHWMLAPLVILALMVLVLSFSSGWLINILNQVANGLL